jgi:hypothetical protein
MAGMRLRLDNRTGHLRAPVTARYPYGQYIYALHDPSSGLTKIGTSCLPENRLSVFRCPIGPGRSRPHEVTPSALILLYAVPVNRSEALAIERRIHKDLMPKRRRREWFFLSPEETIATINRHTKES